MKKKLLWLLAAILVVPILIFLLIGGISMIQLNKMINNTKNTASTAPTVKVDYQNAYNGSGVPDVITEEVAQKYLSWLAPADDENDFRYASDYQDYHLVHLHIGRDQSSYPVILGYEDATLEQIREALDANPNINETYKNFIYQYASDLRSLYPDANLAVLHYNLKTLVIEEMTQAQIDKETLSTNSAACYLRYENKICVLEDLDLSRESDDYIILVHELTHAARSLQLDEGIAADGYGIDIGFYDYHLMGTHAEEGLITNLAYELQGLGNKAIFYPMLASYYRIILQCIDYTHADFFNHSVNYLVDQMDAFMEEEDYAYQVVAMIEAQMSLRYTPYASVDFRDFQPMYEYLMRMYCKKYLTADMSYSDAQAVFDAFYEEITFNFENMNRKYEISEETFLPTFEACLSQLGIEK